MKKIKYFLMMLLTVAVCAGFQSCSDDDEDDGTTFTNYYVECSNVRGGGMNAQQCETFRSELNIELSDQGYFQTTQSEAIADFMDDIQDLARELSIYSFDEPLITTFDLKVMGTGKVVKRATITIGNNGATVS